MPHFLYKRVKRVKNIYSINEIKYLRIYALPNLYPSFNLIPFINMILAIKILCNIIKIIKVEFAKNNNFYYL